MTETGAPAERPLDAWQASFTLAIVSLVAGVVAGVVAYRLFGAVPWHDAQAGVTAALAIALLLPRGARRRSYYLAIFAALTASQLAMVTGNQLLPGSAWPFPPLIGHKLLLFGVAILAVSTRLGLALIALIAASAVALASLLPVPPRFELSTTLAISLGAVALLLHRARARRLERDSLARDRARATAHHMAGTLLALRDLANTPLQTLQLSSELLSRRYPDDPTCQAMQRALDQLGRLNDLLATEEERLGLEGGGREWSDGGASFDAERELERHLGPRGTRPPPHAR